MSYNPDETLAQELARAESIKGHSKPAPVVFTSKRAFNKKVRAESKKFASSVDILSRKFKGEFRNDRGF